MTLSPPERLRTNVVDFRPLQAAQESVNDLLAREKDGELPAEEKSELNHYSQFEHLIRLAKRA